MAINLESLARHRKIIQSENIGARIDSETKRQLDLICAQANVTISTVVCELIKDFIKEQKNV